MIACRGLALPDGRSGSGAGTVQPLHDDQQIAEAEQHGQPVMVNAQAAVARPCFQGAGCCRNRSIILCKGQVLNLGSQ